MITKYYFRILGALILGVGIGVGATNIFRRPDSYGPEYNNMIRIVTTEHLYHASLLREDRSKEVLRLIESTFPSSVLYYKMFKLDSESDLVQLWRIREHGEKHGLKYPSEIAILLANLPARPVTTCDLKTEKKEP